MANETPPKREVNKAADEIVVLIKDLRNLVRELKAQPKKISPRLIGKRCIQHPRNDPPCACGDDEQQQPLRAMPGGAVVAGKSAAPLRLVTMDSIHVATRQKGGKADS